MTWGVSNLRVEFGDVEALDDVTVDTSPGGVLAVVGGDGAGKTTLLRVLAGIGLTHSGGVRLPPEGKTGYVPPHGGVFSDLSVAENMEFTADAYRLADWKDRASLLLDKAALGEFGGRLAGNLSGGQRRKLAGSMALLPRPELLVLDEVTTGVDPVSRMDLWRLIAGAAAAGTAVVLATSYLDEAERAGTAVLLHEGRVLAEGTPDSIIAGVPGTVTELTAPSDPARAWRHGATWRQWDPNGTPQPGQITMEDAAIVAELRSLEETS